MAKQALRIFGAGVRGSLAADLVRWQLVDEYEVEGFYEDRELTDGKGPFGHPILGTVAQGEAEIASSGAHAFVALGVGSKAKACDLFLRLENAGVPIASLIAPAAHVFPSATVGKNAIVFPGAYIGSETTIGHLLCAHGGVTIEHHCTIGHNVLMAPGVALANNVRIGSHAFLGAGVSIIPDVSIGPGTIVGAGSAVLKDLPPHCVAFGTPAQPLRPVNADDDVPVEKEVIRLAESGLA